MLPVLTDLALPSEAGQFALALT